MRNKLLPSLGLLAALIVPLGALFAQVPPPVPALPDSERRTQYSISTSTCACSVNFPLFASGTDVDAWIEVWIGATRYLSTDPTHGWALTSATGPLATIPRPITNAVLTFNGGLTGIVQIVGAERPRRLSQFQENRGVAARDLNQAVTDIIAQNRETWDRTNDITGRTLRTPPGETFPTLPAAAARAGAVLGFDGSGNPTPVILQGPQGPQGPTGPPGLGGGNAPGVNYTAPGTGAVLSNVQARLANELWASDFGAVCNSVTDDHVAFQNMINAAQTLGLRATFTGLCALTTGLTIATSPITFYGAGRAHSYLLPSFGISAITISSAAGYTNIGHMSIDYPAACNHSSSVPAINVVSTDFTTIDDLLILCSDYGITYTSSGGAVLSNTFIALGSATTGIGILEQGAGNNDSSISNVLVTTSAGSPQHAVAMIYCVICSGLKVVNFKGNGSWNTGITIASTGVIDGDFFISNSSLEGINGVGSVGWLIERTDSTSFFGDLVATSTEFSGQYCLLVPTDANGPWVDVLSFNGNTCFTNNAGPAALSVDSVVSLMMANNNLFCATGTATSVVGSQVIGGVVGPNIGGGPSNNGTKWTVNPACAAGTNAGTRVTTIAPF